MEFSLFGILPGHVGLRGKLEDTNGERETVKVSPMDHESMKLGESCNLALWK